MLDDIERDDNAQATIDDLRRDLAKMQRIADLFRQQRDNAARLANDLQVELAEARHEIERLTGSLGASNV